VNGKYSIGLLFGFCFIVGFEIALLLTWTDVFSFEEAWKYLMLVFIIAWKISVPLIILLWLSKRVKKSLYDALVEARLIKPS